ncbi:MAG TPA: VWA domain-containing protein [Terriglobales bacterium]|nr:VWA domain-containing protein [Terriglobales bacterium]
MRVYVLAVVLLSVAVAWAQAPPDHAGTFILSTVDTRGEAITDIAPQDLEVEVGPHTIAVRGLTRYHDAPIRVIVVLDESSSMAARWRVALAIVLDLLQSLPRNATVGLVGINGETPEVINGRSAITRYLTNRARQGPGGWTRLWDNVHAALGALPQPRPTDVIFVISDGDDTASKLSFRDLEHEVRAARVRVSGALLLENPTAAAPTSADLGELIDETGGWDLTAMPFLHTAPEDGRIEVASAVPNYAAFFRTMFDFYLVEVGGEFRPDAPLRVRMSPGRQAVLVSAPQHLAPAQP